MKNNKMKIVITLFVALIVTVSCKKPVVKPLPENYALSETSLYPEGIAFSQTTGFTYVGSYYKGKVVKMDLDGVVSDFIIDPSLVAVVGILIDEENNRLWLCNSDAGISLNSGAATTGILAEVIAYDLTTGAKFKTIDLSSLYAGGHFLNDIVMDGSGNLYITDSFSPVVYKIDANDNASVLVSDPIFNVPPQTFGLNGIVYHPDNYLIVGKAFDGTLYKIPLNNPTSIQQITLNSSVNSLDGMLLIDNNTLALVSNNFTGAPFMEAVYKIETSNSWTTGSITSTFTDLKGQYPTTMTEINNGLFVSFGYFPELIDPTSAPNSGFELQKITFL